MNLRNALRTAGAMMVFFPAVMYAENIGVAREPPPNARSQELTKIFSTFLGKWKGTYSYFDERQGKYVTGPSTLEFSKTPIPNVIALDVLTDRPGQPPIHVYTVMV